MPRLRPATNCTRAGSVDRGGGTPGAGNRMIWAGGSCGWRGVVFATSLIGIIATDVSAASLSYRLEQSNRLPDGPGYLEFTIADGPGGSIDFTVPALPALLETAGHSLEIQSFAFNAASGARPANVTGLPGRWVARGPVNMDGFGRFGMQLWSNGREALQSLSFSIVDVDTPWSYVAPGRT